MAPLNLRAKPVGFTVHGRTVRPEGLPAGSGRVPGQLRLMAGRLAGVGSLGHCRPLPGPGRFLRGPGSGAAPAWSRGGYPPAGLSLARSLSMPGASPASGFQPETV